jgi:hypothetical protein
LQIFKVAGLAKMLHSGSARISSSGLVMAYLLWLVAVGWKNRRGCGVGEAPLIAHNDREPQPRRKLL